MANRSQSHYLDIGVLGEDLVTQWLKSTCWTILERRWSCRWGEIDIIARFDPVQPLHPPLLQSSELPSEELTPAATLSRCRKRREPLLQSSELPSEELRKRREPPLGLCATPYSLLPTPFLSFIEVKTRSYRNWDAGGLLSITPRKQAKLWQTARCFLAAHPHFAAYPCRFDVALVSYQKASTPFYKSSEVATTVVEVAGYRMLLQDYISSAFEEIG